MREEGRPALQVKSSISWGLTKAVPSENQLEMMI
jgi:hypothetical protein